jgi:hypothetical protein
MQLLLPPLPSRLLALRGTLLQLGVCRLGHSRLQRLHLLAQAVLQQQLLLLARLLQQALRSGASRAQQHAGVRWAAQVVALGQARQGQLLRVGTDTSSVSARSNSYE